jgi:hypothetical protein
MFSSVLDIVPFVAYSCHHHIFFKNYFLTFWPDEFGNVYLAGLFSDIIQAAKATPIEEHFCRTVDQRSGWWWSDKGLITFDKLNAMFWAHLKQVFHKSSIKIYSI